MYFDAHQDAARQYVLQNDMHRARNEAFHDNSVPPADRGNALIER